MVEIMFKICFVTKYNIITFPRGGGAELQAYLIANELSKKGYKDLSQTIVISDPEQTASYTMVKRTIPSPKPPPASSPKSDFPFR